MATDSVDNTTTEQTGVFTWRAHPARERPWAAIGAFVIIAAVAAATMVLAGAWWWGVLAAVVLILALNRFFFPSSFSIEEDGVSASYLFGTKRFAWTDVRRFCHDRNGAYLSTRSQRSRLDAYRGIHLLFGDSRDEVLCRIRQRLAQQGDASCSG